MIVDYVEYEELNENFNASSFMESRNTDFRLIFLMELNAWAIVLNQQSTALKNSLEIRGNLFYIS